MAFTWSDAKAKDFLEFDVTAIGNFLNTRIMHELQNVGITKDMLHLYCQDPLKAPATVEEAVKQGTALFDAIYYFANATKCKDMRWQRATASTDYYERQMSSLAEYGLLLLFRGGASRDDSQPLPAIMRNVFKITTRPSNIGKDLATFDIDLVPTEWIRFIQFSTNTKIKNRLILGMPGYRYVQLFVNYPDGAIQDEADNRAGNFLKYLANNPAWDLHPATKAEWVVRLGSINAAAEYLLGKWLTEEERVDLHASKKIPRAINPARLKPDWNQWDFEKKVENKIFP